MTLNLQKRNTKILWLLSAIMLLYAIVPLFGISFYNNPSADDYKMVNVYSQSSFWQLQKDTYLNWSGRYMATMVLWLHPLLHNANYYNILPLVLFVVLFFSIWFCIKKFGSIYFGNAAVFFITSLCFVCFLAYLPSLAEGVFWGAGSLIYTLPIILFLHLIVVLKNIYNNSSKVLFNIMLACVLFFIIIGCNEASLIGAMCLAFYFIIISYKKKSKNFNVFISIFLFALFCSLCAVLAPGNFVRMQGVPSHGNLFIALLAGGAFSFIAFLNWVLIALFLGIIIAILYIENNDVLAKTLTIDTKTQVFKKWCIASLAIVPIYGVYVVNFYSTNSDIAGRTNNVIYFNFLLIVVAAIVYYIIKSNVWAIFIKQYFNQLFYSIFLMFFLLLIFNNQNINKAYIDSLTHEASGYKAENEIRQKEIEKANSNDIILLNAWQHVPEALVITDIENEPTQNNYWINESMAFYYKKQIIILKKGETKKVEPIYTQIKNWFKSK